MIDRVETPGAWYGECLPNGRYVTGFNTGWIQTSEGDRYYPTALIYTRIHPVSGFIGVSNPGDEAIEYIGRFGSRGLACGNSPVAYWPDGNLVITQCVPPYGSQGIRWIDDRIHPGDETIADPNSGIYQYTDIYNIKVGQGGNGIHGEDPLVIIYGGIRYLLESGTCRVIRFNYDPVTQVLAISCWKMSANSNVRFLLTLNDVLALELFPLNPPDHIVAIAKPCWLGWFEFTDNLTYIPPSNSYLWVRQNGIITNGEAQFAQWVQGDNVDEIERQVLASEKPCVAYWDSRQWPRAIDIKQEDWICLQAYCRATETPAQFEVEMRHYLDTMSELYFQICLVCQCYTSNSSLTNNLIGLVPVYARLARDYPAVNMLLAFSDQGRATGLNDNPQVKPYWEELFKGITGTPVEDEELLPLHIYNALVAERPNFPTPMGDKGAELINKVAFQHKSEGWGNEKKDGGTTCPQPETGIRCGCDIIRTLEWGYDCFVDAENACTPKREKRGPADPNRFVAPVGEEPPVEYKVDILYYDQVVKRSDPNGLLVRFDVQAGFPVVEITLDLVDDGEPAIPIRFKDEPRVDGRYCRALAFKPTVNGEWPLLVTARDNRGNEYRSDGTHIVRIVF